MTALTTYVGLQAAVKDWANRMDSSVSGRVTDFIRLGEERIWITGEKVVRSQRMIAASPLTLTIPANQNWVALPDDWLGFERIRSAGDTYMEYIEPALLESLPAPGNSRYYSIEGQRLLVGQIPTANLALTARYLQHPGYLEDVATTWLLTRAPSVYLFAALIEAATYVKKTDKVAEYGALLAKALNGLDSAERAAYVSGGPLRTRRS